MTYRTSRFALWLGLAALVWTAGCSEGIGAFTITEESGEKTIDGRSGPTSNVPLTSDLLPEFNFDINLQEKLDQRNVGPAKDVHMKSFTLRVTDEEESNNDEDNLNFIDSMTIFASTAGDGGPDKKRIAWNDNIPDDGSRSVEFNTDESVDLKPYIEQGLVLDIEASGNFPNDKTAIQAVTALIVEVL
jgi:hypothetical protein